MTQPMPSEAPAGARIPVTPEALAGRGYVPPDGHAAFAGVTQVPVVISELAAAATALPLAFAEEKGGPRLVALTGLEAGHNLLLGPEGRWLGGYVPAWVRAHPFALEGEPPRLTVEAVHLAEDGAPLLGGQGGPGALVRQMDGLLHRLAEEQAAADRAAVRLSRLGVLAPCPIHLCDAEGEREIAGLRRLDEAALHRLPDAAFLELRRDGGLALAHAQLFSMRVLPTLLWLHRIHRHGDTPPPAVPAGPDGFDFADPWPPLA